MNPARRFLTFACLSFFAVLPGLAVAETPPLPSPVPVDGAIELPGAARETPHFQSFRADYKVTRSVLDSDFTLASADLRLELGSEGGYRYSSNLRPAKLIALFYGDELAEYSRGHLEDEGVRPDLYEMRLSGRKAREGSIVFDREAGVVVQRFKGREVRQGVPPEAHDRLSLQLEMARDLAAGRRAMQYLMVDRNRLRVYRFEVKGEERIETPLGSYETLRVELAGRLRLEDAAGLDVDTVHTETDLSGEDQTTFWFAPMLGHLPVRIRHEDEDLGTFTMSIERLEMPLALRAQAQGVTVGAASP
ncbi:MAG: DUF3108 domain-containing protein [Gammaproteobacteria bacterium]|jgi:hypothetical protein|nr:DUF3108 domain-containing protein [Gammaproteobacteria bacterium]